MAIERKPFHAFYIDGLRAIAVLSVIVYHLNPEWLSGGFAGVDVFFVISGFVVALSVSELKDIGFFRFLTYFYARRLVRITPALVFCLLATFLASAVFIPDAWLSASNQKTGLFAFFGLSNFTLAANTGNYFSPAAEFNPFTHTWSLAVEEQFYLIFPFMFFVWLKSRIRLSILIFAVLFVTSLICAAILGQQDRTQAFYMIWARFWELAIGVLLFQVLHFFGHTFDEKSVCKKWQAGLANAGLLMVVVGLLSAQPQSAPFPACLMPVAGTVLVLGALHGRRGGIAYFLLTRKLMVFVGKISYSLYLWHWPIFVLFRWTVGLETYAWQFAALVLTAICAVLSYYMIEQPPRRGAYRARKSILIASGLAVIRAGYGLALVIVANQQWLSLSVVSKDKDLWYPEGPALITSAQGCKASTEEMIFSGGRALKHFREACDSVNSDGRNIFVLGDSHAMHYRGMLRKLVADSGVTVFQYTVGGCPFMSFQPSRENEQCKYYGSSAISDMLQKIKPGDIVFLASLRLPRLVDQWGVFGIDSAKNAVFSKQSVAGRDNSVQEALPVLREINSRGALIIFEAPTPMLESVPFRCADWFNHKNPICDRGLSVSRALLEELRTPTLKAYKKIQMEVPGVRIWDPMPTLCVEGECQAYRDGNPLYFDGDHLTYYSNLMLLPSFKSFIGRSETASR